MYYSLVFSPTRPGGILPSPLAQTRKVASRDPQFAIGDPHTQSCPTSYASGRARPSHIARSHASDTFDIFARL